MTNIWWRRGRTLYTPALDLGILAGVTRTTLLEEAGGRATRSARARSRSPIWPPPRGVHVLVGAGGDAGRGGRNGRRPRARRRGASGGAARGSASGGGRGGLSKLRFRIAAGVHGALYRALGGRLVGRYGEAPLLLLTTTGRRTGRRRTVPLLYASAGDAFVVVASMGGEPRHPAWFHNLRAEPEAEVELPGRERRRVRARIAEGEERDRLWRQMVVLYAGYETYATRTSRRIPVVVLEPVSGTSSAPYM